jgi:hypothetical protein
MVDKAGNKTGGRKKGTPDKASKANQELAKLYRVQPLDVMLEASVELYDAAKASGKSEDWKAAVSVAKEAAPYVCPKISPVNNSDGSDTKFPWEVLGGV